MLHQDVIRDSAAIYRKIGWRIMPFLILVFMLSYLDRVNIGYAKLQFSIDLGFSNTVFGLGAGIFFLGYFFFEVPSNLMLRKTGARLTIARIMVLWGLVSAAMALVRSESAFYIMRFLLGVAEAGLVPGVVLYLTYWFPAEKRAQMTAWFLLAIPISGILGAPLSGYIMQSFDQVADLRGWQWMFLIEGLPSVLVGLWALFYLDNGPDSAHWLTADEKAHIRQTLQLESETQRHQGGHAHFWDAFRSGRFWLLTAMYFTSVLGVTGLAFWLPQIIKDLGITDLVSNGQVTAVPYCAAAVVMLLVSRSSDRRAERRWHYALSCLLGAAGLVLSGMALATPVVAVAGLAVAAAGVFASLAVFWSLSTSYLQGTAAVAGIAVINSVANLAGYAGPFAMGVIRDRMHSMTWGLYLIAVCLVGGALLALALPAPRFRRDSESVQPAPPQPAS
jgi:MFS family permease